MIGIFDSGVGGLSVFCELKKLIPDIAITYLSDSANFPYGEKQQEELLRIASNATKRLISEGANTIVVACNSATVSTIKYLREKYPEIDFVGVEPAIKPALKNNHAEPIGLLATKKTVMTYHSDILVDNIKIIKHHDPYLIDKIENDYHAISDFDMQKALDPFIEAGVKTVVLGCTHFYFLREKFADKFPEIQFLEPAPAVAKHVLEINSFYRMGECQFLVSGDVDNFRHFLENVVGYKNGDIRKVS